MAAVYLQSLNNGNYALQNSDSTNKVTVLTAGASGTKIDNIVISSNDTVARTLTLYKTIGGVDYILGTVSVTANTGNTTTLPPISFLNNVNVMSGYGSDVNGNHYIFLESGAVLKASVTVAVSATKAVYVMAQGFDL